MTENYKSFAEIIKQRYAGPYTATDIIIRHNDGVKEGVVIIGRKYFPLGLAFPGGMAEHMKWSENAIKEGRRDRKSTP